MFGAASRTAAAANDLVCTADPMLALHSPSVSFHTENFAGVYPEHFSFRVSLPAIFWAGFSPCRPRPSSGRAAGRAAPDTGL